MISANAMLYKIAERLRPLAYGVSRSGGFDSVNTSSTLVDYNRREPNGYFTGGTLFLIDAGFDARTITGYALDSSQGSMAGTFTFAPPRTLDEGGAYSGSYAALDKKYSRDVLMHALNIALSELGPFVQDDSWSLNVIAGKTDYPLPEGVTNILRVQFAEDVSGAAWEAPYRYWREYSGFLRFDDEYLPAQTGAPIRLYYEAAHPRVVFGSDLITDALHPDVIATLAAIHAVRMRLPVAGNSDPEPTQLLQMLAPQYQALRAAHPKRTMQRDTRFPSLPSMFPGATPRVSSAPVEPPGGGGGGPQEPDEIPPSAPEGVTAQATHDSVTLAWLDSSDNTGVTGYRVYRDGTALATTPVASYTDADLTPATSYRYEVSGLDAAGNEGPRSEALDVATTNPPGDATPPSAPTGLAVSASTSTSLTLTWTPSTDNLAVAHYTVRRGGQAIAITTNATYTDRAVTPATSYTYTVTAHDAAGNQSASSNVVTGTTTAGLDAFYVSLDGSAAGAGTIEEPWSLNHALNGAGGGLIGPGDVVYLRGGTYTMTAKQIVDGLTGTNANRITIRPYPGERVTLRNAYSNYFDTLEIQDVAYTDFEGLAFTAYLYPRETAAASAVDMAHVWENPANAQNHVRWRNCRFQDAPGRAMELSVNSTNITVEGCLFFYNGSGANDWTILAHGAAGCNKVIRSNVFINNAGDDARIFSTAAGSQALADIDLIDNIFLNTGGLWANPARSMMIGGETDTPTDIAVTGNIVYNRLPTDGNARALQLGNIGASTPGSATVAVAATSDDGTYTSGGTFSNTSTLQAGAGGRGAFLRFANLNIPAGATITSAVLTAYVTNTDATDTARLTVRGDKSAANPAAPTSYADLSARARTTAQVSWNIGPSWTTGDQQSPDLSAILQELVAYTAGEMDNLVLYVEDAGTSQDDIWIHDRSSGATNAARLAVNWTVSSGDGGALNVSVTNNLFVGQPVDLSGGSYTGVAASGNTVHFHAAHVGATTTAYPSNTWSAAYPTSGVTVLSRVHPYNSRIANVLILNWAGAPSVTINDADLGTLSLDAGDSYTLCNAENVYSDRITGIYNGAGLTIPMTGRSQAATQGAVGTPASLFPTVGAFVLYATEGAGGQLPPSVPANLTANLNDNAVVLSWSASSGDVAGYTVYRDGTQIASVSVNSYTDANRTPGQTYTYRVGAYSSVGMHSTQSAPVSATVAISGRFAALTGSAAGDGSAASPWSLPFVLSGANGAIAPGETVWVRGGEYTIPGVTYITLRGASANPIRVRAYPGERPEILLPNTSGTALLLNNSQYVHFYHLVFRGTGYTRINEQVQGTYEGATIGHTAGAAGVKFYGCHFKNASTHGVRAFEHAGTVEYNGCLFLFNGANNQYDHGVYLRNNAGTPTIFQDCIFAHNAGHGLHGYASSQKYNSDVTLVGNLIYQNGSLYDQATRQALIGSTAYAVEGCTVRQNVIYTNLGVDSNADSFRLGYGGGQANNRLEGNAFVGSPVYLEDGTASAFLNNRLYYGAGSSSQRGETAVLMAGNGNVMSATPSSGIEKQIRAYSWDSRRANIGLLNFGRAATVTVTHAELTAAGVTIQAGDSYTLRNAENYFGDVISGTYNGTSIVLPMTGRTVETPYGLPVPASAFPVFGAFVLTVGQ